MGEQEESLQTIHLYKRSIELNVENDTVVFGGVDSCYNERARRRVEYAKRD